MMYVNYVWINQDVIVGVIKMVQTKIINHRDIEKCKISKKSIDTMKDKFSIIVECEGEKIVSIGFYKSELLLDLIKGGGELVQKELLKKQGEMVNNMLSKLPIGDKVFNI